MIKFTEENNVLTEKEKIEFAIAEFPNSLRALKKTLHSELAADTKYIDNFIDTLIEEAEFIAK